MTLSLAAAKKTRVDAAVDSVLSKPDGISTEEEEEQRMALMAFLCGKDNFTLV